MATGIDTRKEGVALFRRSSQKSFKKSLRLHCDTVRAIFGTRYLPVISNEDPLRYKAMRHGHELELGTVRRTHNLEKTTAEYMANPDMEAAVERHRSKYMKQ